MVGVGQLRGRILYMHGTWRVNETWKMEEKVVCVRERGGGKNRQESHMWGRAPI